MRGNQPPDLNDDIRKINQLTTPDFYFFVKGNGKVKELWVGFGDKIIKG